MQAGWKISVVENLHLYILYTSAVVWLFSLLNVVCLWLSPWRVVVTVRGCETFGKPLIVPAVTFCSGDMPHRVPSLTVAVYSCHKLTAVGLGVGC
mgnify:FL=1